MGDHTECFQVEFDPTVVEYEELLEMFWTSHDATHQPWKVQYASLILTAGDAQLAAARESAMRFEQAVGRTVATRIEPLDRFWLAEEYHQKYYLRNDRLLAEEMQSIYPRDEEFVASTACARINGYLYGAGSCMQLEEELPRLGLSEGGMERLRTRCRK